jgi:hypothetical protein
VAVYNDYIIIHRFVFVVIVVVLKISSFHALCPLLLVAAVLIMQKRIILCGKILKISFCCFGLISGRNSGQKKKKEACASLQKGKRPFLSSVLKYSYGLRACAAI